MPGQCPPPLSGRKGTTTNQRFLGALRQLGTLGIACETPVVTSTLFHPQTTPLKTLKIR